MKCSISLGFAWRNGTFQLSPHEMILAIALINIDYLYNITLSIDFFIMKKLLTCRFCYSKDWTQNCFRQIRAASAVPADVNTPIQ